MTFTDFKILIAEITKLDGKLNKFETSVVNSVLRAGKVSLKQGKVVEEAYRRVAGGGQFQKKAII